MLNTERLRIYPASREQMETMIASEQEEGPRFTLGRLDVAEGTR